MSGSGTQSASHKWKRTSRKRTSRPGKRRPDLVIKPIRSERDHREALAQIERLWGADPGTREGATLDALATLVSVYEKEMFPIGPPDPIEAIRFRLEQSGKTERDLEGIIGTRARVWEVMNSKRPLTLAMIRALHDELGIPVESLIDEAR